MCMADVFAPSNQNRGIGIIGDTQSSTDREDLLGRRPLPLWLTLHVGTTVKSRFESPQCIVVNVTRRVQLQLMSR